MEREEGAYVEMTVSGSVPQLPIRDGLTTPWDAFSLSELIASWYIWSC